MELDPESAEKLVENQLNETKNRQKPSEKVIDKKNNEDYIDIIVNYEDMTPEEQAVISVMGKEPMHVDDIISACGLPAQTVLSVLTMLEIDGAVKQLPGKHFLSHITVK